VADEIEGVVVSANMLGQFVEGDALGGEFLQDDLLALGVIPDGEEIVEGRIGFADRLAGSVLERLGDELAVFVEILDALGGDADLDVVHVVSRGAGTGRIHDDAAGRVFTDHGTRLVLIGRNHRFVVLWLADLDRGSVEALVCKKRSRPEEVHDGEEEFAVVLVDARSASDDLLELRYRADALIEHDEVASLRVHAGGHELRGAGDDGKGGMKFRFAPAAVFR